jgi:hypothetical protein
MFIVVAGDGDLLYRLGPPKEAYDLWTEAEFGLRNVLNNNRTIADVQKLNNCRVSLISDFRRILESVYGKRE